MVHRHAGSALVDAPFTINSLTLDGSWRGALTVNSTLTVSTGTYNAAYLQVTGGGNLTLDGPVTNQGEVYVDGNYSQLTVGSPRPTRRPARTHTRQSMAR